MDAHPVELLHVAREEPLEAAPGAEDDVPLVDEEAHRGADRRVHARGRGARVEDEEAAPPLPVAGAVREGADERLQDPEGVRGSRSRAAPCARSKSPDRIASPTARAFSTFSISGTRAIRFSRRPMRHGRSSGP